MTADLSSDLSSEGPAKEEGPAKKEGRSEGSGVEPRISLMARMNATLA